MLTYVAKNMLKNEDFLQKDLKKKEEKSQEDGGKMSRRWRKYLEKMEEHYCWAWNLWIGIYNGKMVFNRKLGNGWSDLDDLFGRPPWNFDSDKIVKKVAL